ncbi:hypothetical protein B0H16DRAFT_1686018 [Mycena metata]|uniref:NB-ARC domain-containing protein n=1 Tax=Mycena metata TaxID=1033252 RepID=A0AAD7JQN3_9AGAR|nr:hypothetical protein B0H16DRAFT_1686018 [Mycena metata]
MSKKLQKLFHSLETYVSLSSPTMFPASSPNSAPSNPQPLGKKKGSSRSKSEWLAPAILAAKTITAAAECASFAYIKGVFGTVLILLETIEKVKRNHEDLKELCNTTTEIVAILHNQISTHGNTAAVEFKFLSIKAVIIEVQNLHHLSKGFRKKVKEFMGSINITDEIAEYQNKIQGVYFKLKLLAAIDTNSKVNNIHAIITAPGFVVAPPNQTINDCPPPSRIFHGRQTILARMHQFFIPESGKQCIYVLHGLGGSGKTQIALKFVQEASANFSDIFFMDASTLDTISTGLKMLAVSKGVGDSTQDALAWLQSKRGEWLLFFDNADDPKMNLNKFFPLCNHGNIIITSRNPGLRVYGEHSLVSDMEETDSVTLLLQSAAKETSEENLQVAAKIVKVKDLIELYYLPLAIAQAGAFISKSEDLAGYLTLEKPQQSHDQYAWTVYTTWQISFDQLSKPAARFLQLCSFLHYTGITEDIFSNASKYSDPVWLPPKKDLQEPLQFLSCFLGPTGGWSSLSFLDITNEIKGYSLISFDTVIKVFTIHPLVHAWSRSTLNDEESSRSCINSILGMSISKISDQDMILTSLRFLPHLGTLRPGSGPDFRAAFWEIFFAASKLQEAHNLIVQVVKDYKSVFGEQHLATLEVMHRLGSTYHKLGEYKKAKELEMVVFEKRIKILGEEHPDTLIAIGNLALTHHNLGENEKAKELEMLKAKELEMVVLEKRTTLLSGDHADTLMAMGNLAMTHQKLGDYQKAKELGMVVLEKRTTFLGELEMVVLQKRTKALGEEHPNTLLAMGNLALTHQRLGDYQRAKELGMVALEKRTTLLGGDHAETLMTMGNLAMTHQKLGDDQKAKELEMVVLQKRTKILGEEHPDTLLAMGNLAGTYSHLGDYEKAKELEMVVLEKQTKVLGEEHPNTLLAMGNLALTHQRLGDFDKARELGVTVLEKWTTLLGKNHTATLLAIGNLALTHQKLRDFEKARVLGAIVLERRTLVLGEGHPDTLLAMGNLAGTHQKLGDFKKARGLEATVLEKRTTLLGQDHPDTLFTMGNLASTHFNLADFEKAKELEIVVLEKRRQLFGDGHPLSILAMQNLAHTYHKLQKQKEAEELEQLVKESQTLI